MRLATFVTACIFGSHAYAKHSPVADAHFPGLHEIYAWVDPKPGFFGIPAQETAALASRLMRRVARPQFISAEHVDAGFALASRLLVARPDYCVADPVALIVMTYQAMILHSRQHAGASVALLAVVAEAALEEIMYSYGLVKEYPAKMPAVGPTSPVSSSKARAMKLKDRADALFKAGIIDNNLFQRIESLRISRNDLMHENKDSTSGQSGSGLTAIRDILRYATNEDRFELNMGWSYRI